MKKISILICCIILWSFVSICHGTATVTVTDMADRQVEVPFDPEKIICIGPGALRLIVYLQAQSKVVGVEDMEKMNLRGRPYWLAHPELWNLPRCGPGGPVSINKKPDLEAVLALSPEIIFVTYMKPHMADQIQQTLKIPVVVLSYGTFATFDTAIYDAMRIAGKILNCSKRADAVIAYVESLRGDLGKRTEDGTGGVKKGEKATVYVGGIGYRGAHGIGSTEQHYIPFEWTHANNIADNLKPTTGSHVFVDQETLLKLNPDIIFIDGGGLVLVAGDYKKNPSYYNGLKAFTHHRVYTLLPFNWYVTNVGTALADAYAIGKILFENRFRDIDPEHMADEIHTFLVGKPVYEQLAKDYGPIGQKAPFLR